MDRRAADLLPEKCYCIKTDDLHAVFDMQPDDAQEFQKDFGVAEIQIHLIVTEGTPHVALPIRSFDFAQKRRGPGAHHHAQVVFG